MISVLKCVRYFFFTSLRQFVWKYDLKRKIRNQRKRCWKNIRIIIRNRNRIWPRPVCQTKNWQTQLKGRFPSGSKAMWNYPCLLNLSLHFTLIIPSDPRDLLANCFSSIYFIMFDVSDKKEVAVSHYACTHLKKNGGFFEVWVNKRSFLSSKEKVFDKPNTNTGVFYFVYSAFYMFSNFHVTTMNSHFI